MICQPQPLVALPSGTFHASNQWPLNFLFRESCGRERNSIFVLLNCKNASNRHNTTQDIMHAEGPYMGNVDRVSMRQKHLIWAAVAGQLKTEQGAGAETLARRAAEHAGRIGRNGAGEEAMARNGGLARVKAAVQATHRCSELEREATVRQVATVYVPDA